MNNAFQVLHQVMWISGVSSVVLGAFLIMLTWGRGGWSRLLGREEAFWKRLGFSGSGWAAGLRRFEESRLAIGVVAVLLSMHVLLFAWAAGTCARLRTHPPQAASTGEPVRGGAIPLKPVGTPSGPTHPAR